MEILFFEKCFRFKISDLPKFYFVDKIGFELFLQNVNKNYNI